jgi:hypothetical protein
VSEQYDGPAMAAHILRLQAENKRLVAERDKLAVDLAESTKDRNVFFADLVDTKSRLAEAEALLEATAAERDRLAADLAEARGLLRLWRRWYESPAATLEAEERGERISIDTDAFFSRTEGK